MQVVASVGIIISLSPVLDMYSVVLYRSLAKINLWLILTLFAILKSEHGGLIYDCNSWWNWSGFTNSVE